MADNEVGLGSQNQSHIAHQIQAQHANIPITPTYGGKRSITTTQDNENAFNHHHLRYGKAFNHHMLGREALVVIQIPDGEP
eukprot:scaffold18816_cov32-Tisochrysis_lutea.AAC.4